MFVITHVYIVCMYEGRIDKILHISILSDTILTYGYDNGMGVSSHLGPKLFPAALLSSLRPTSPCFRFVSPYRFFPTAPGKSLISREKYSVFTEVIIIRAKNENIHIGYEKCTDEYEYLGNVNIFFAK